MEITSKRHWKCRKSDFHFQWHLCPALLLGQSTTTKMPTKHISAYKSNSNELRYNFHSLMHVSFLEFCGSYFFFLCVLLFLVIVVFIDTIFLFWCGYEPNQTIKHLNRIHHRKMYSQELDLDISHFSFVHSTEHLHIDTISAVFRPSKFNAWEFQWWVTTELKKKKRRGRKKNLFPF